MALFNDYITTKGKRMLAGMLAGEVENLEFTRVVLGDGENRNPEEATEVISPICDAVIESVVLNDNNVLSITASFTNESIETGFYMKEKGIYISDGKEEVLAIYANAGSTASYIEPAASGLIKKVIRSSITFSQADIINVTLKDSGYANEIDFENHVKNKENPHEVTAEQVGLGNVPNVATNDQVVTYKISEQEEVEELKSGEILKTALRKLAKAVADYISHKADEVAHITEEERTAWTAKLGAEKIAANLTTTTEGMVLAAAMGKTLKEQIDTNASAISTLNSNIARFEEYTGGSSLVLKKAGDKAYGSENWTQGLFLFYAIDTANQANYYIAYVRYIINSMPKILEIASNNMELAEGGTNIYGTMRVDGATNYYVASLAVF